MLLNGHQLVDRSDQPSTNQRVGLRTYFVNNGIYTDPYEISSVQIFKRSDTLTPNSVLGAENLVSATPLMTFAASAANATGGPVHCTIVNATTAQLACSNSFNPDTYEPYTTASGIYKMETGEFVVVLDESLNLSGWDYTTSTTTIASSVSAVGDYVDIWTVKLSETSKYQIFVNEFTLTESSFFTVTEPLLISTSNKLLNSNVRLGEDIDLRVTTESTLQNKSIDQSMINVFSKASVKNPAFEIRKINYGDPKRGSVVVSSYGDTDDFTSVTADNTILFTWNTDDIDDSVGSKYGTYSVQVSYEILNQTIISPLFYLTVS